MKESASRKGVAVLGLPVALFVLGAAWALFDIYALGHWDPKFGPWENFELGLAVLGVLAVAAGVVNAVVVLGAFRFLETWSPRSLMAASAAAAALALAVLGATEIAHTVTDPLVSLLGGRDQPVIHVAVLSLVPCVLMAATFLAGEAIRRHRDRSTTE